jgi:hypothetical protein
MGSQDVLAAEDRFFHALLQGDPVGLTGVLTPDFLLIDVMTGSEIPGPVLTTASSGSQRTAGIRTCTCMGPVAGDWPRHKARRSRLPSRRMR